MIWKVGIFVVIVTTAFAGCLAMSPLYQVTTKEYQDIRGDYTVDEFLLYKDVLGNTAVTIRRHSPSTYYTAWVKYDGSDWRFMEKLLIQTDTQLYTLRDENPHRSVLYGGTVLEIVNIDLNDKILADLRSTDTLRIQYYLEPVTIPSEGLIALRTFLSE